METKICTKCKVEKNVDEFRIVHRKTGDCLFTQCRECEKESSRLYYYKHKEERKQIVSEYGKKYRQGDKYKNYQKQYRESHKKEAKEYNMRYRLEKKAEISKQRKNKYHENKEELNKKSREKYRNNVEFSKRVRKKSKEYYENNKQVIFCKIKLKYMNDPVFKLKNTIRNNIRESFIRKGMNKSKHTEEIVGIPLDELYLYLLDTFEKNYGYKWDEKEEVHIDHIKPLKYAKTEEDVIKFCYYTNLQLLKGKDNLIKNSKLDWTLTKDE